MRDSLAATELHDESCLQQHAPWRFGLSDEHHPIEASHAPEKNGLTQLYCVSTSEHDGPPVEWTDNDVVHLYWGLVQELGDLALPNTPLADKLEMLEWVLDETPDDQPFSFSHCLNVVGCSPLSPAPYMGKLDLDAVRAAILRQAKAWLRETVAQLPGWAQEIFYAQPAKVADELRRNPQWLNEQIKRVEDAPSSPQLDMFGAYDRVA